ncbi:hypothetical [Yersinia pestis KIM10+]|uniref:Uncharacterized protein n=1 Tax=Yersinia pestis TaxID=632 RepID=Q8CKA7_YERPE|nr:hypothetical [Yersinia pestis KIM10+]
MKNRREQLNRQQRPGCAINGLKSIPPLTLPPEALSFCSFNFFDLTELPCLIKPLCLINRGKGWRK